MRGWWRFVRTTPCMVLLVVQLAGVLLYPSMESTSAGRAVFSRRQADAAPPLEGDAS